MRSNQLEWMIEHLLVIQTNAVGRLENNDRVRQKLIELLANLESPCAVLSQAITELQLAIDEELRK